MIATSTHIARPTSKPSSTWRHRGFVVATKRPRPLFRLSWRTIEQAMPMAAYVVFFVGASALFLA
jgi:hypothetical protein